MIMIIGNYHQYFGILKLMHELSIVRNIIQIATEQVKANAAKKVETIEMEIGDLSGIEMDAFLFAWDTAVERSVLENAERIIHRQKGKARCQNCELEFKVEQFYDPCPGCGEYFGELIQGKELKIRSLEIS